MSSISAVVVLAVLLGASGCLSEPRESARDGADVEIDPRTAIALPPAGQQAVLEEMRQMLGAVGGAMSAAAQGNPAAVLAAVVPAGTAEAADPAIEARLPAEWKALAERTHTGFDSLTAAVNRSPGGQALKDTVLVRLAGITGSCMACHEAFRVTLESRR